jgi:hypothetical protein
MIVLSLYAAVSVFMRKHQQGFPVRPSLNVLNSSAVLTNGLDEMCYFDQEVFICGDWKWRSCREGCSKVTSGDTCGMKLILFSQYTHERCNIC